MDQGLRNWAVNGRPGGDAGIGTLAPQPSSASYKAPAAVPAQNPVAVSVEAPDALPPLPPAQAMTTTLVSNIKVVDQVQVYQGTFFGRVVVKIGTEESFYEQSANLRFTRNAALSNAGAEWYDGSGTVHLRARPFPCSEGSASGAVFEARLQLFNEGPLAGTYQLSVGSLLPINSLTCGDPPEPIDTNLVGGISPGGTDVCPPIAIGDDRGRLAGSWSCQRAGRQRHRPRQLDLACGRIARCG